APIPAMGSVGASGGTTMPRRVATSGLSTVNCAPVSSTSETAEPFTTAGTQMRLLLMRIAMALPGNPVAGVEAREIFVGGVTGFAGAGGSVSAMTSRIGRPLRSDQRSRVVYVSPIRGAEGPGTTLQGRSSWK